MRRGSVLQLASLVILAIGCSLGPGASPSPSPSAPSPSAPATQQSAAPMASTSGPQRVPLPSGFPILPGSVPVAMPNDDSGLIGLWSTDQAGSAAYDFYAAALPEAGYPIVGLYPGGAAAVIRFTLPDGAIWQMLAHDGGNGTVAIEVRLDRP
jgi:hypothetical protein